MNTITIKSLHLLNFKGVAKLDIEFNPCATNICGRNASGKTTIFDAFTWLLFGKDSKDRKSFDIKTYDKDGNTIARIPHEVSATIDVNGHTITLCRKFNEKWTKRRGSATEEFTGHEEERLYNEVPCSLREWNDKIAEICPEQVFKFITNPSYFASQKEDVQRNMLFRMAGGISDADIASGNEDFTKLLSMLTNKSMDEYKKEIQAKKRIIKAEISDIPGRIDENNFAIPEAEDWAKIESDIKTNHVMVVEIDNMLQSLSSRYASSQKEKINLIKQHSDIQSRMNLRSSAILRTLQNEEYDKQRINDRTADAIEDKEKHRATLVKHLAQAVQYLYDLNSKRNALIAEWKEIKASQIEMSDDAFVCPTCGRRYDIDEIDKIRETITAKFQADKAKRLEDNRAKGLTAKKSIEEANHDLEEVKAEIEKIGNEIIELRNRPVAVIATSEAIIAKRDAMLADDKEYLSLQDKSRQINEQIESIPDAANTDDSETLALKAKKDAILANTNELNVRLAKREQISSIQKRIFALETTYRAQSEELAKLEGIEFTIDSFSRARTEAIENKINNLFTMVKFKMFETQINGGEVETCEATVDGVPYSSINNAAQVNAGLDIINAICKFEQVNAPIFIDNAESVNALLSTDSQIIRLVVTDDANLIIK